MSLNKKFTLLLGTTNKGKIRELTEKLNTYFEDIKNLKDFPEIEPPEETGKSFFENALLKARYYSEKTGLPVLAEDSGLEVDALGGAPGIYSSRFAGERATDEDNIKKLLTLLADIPFEKRGARFKCVMILYHPSGKYLKAEGVWEGRIAFEPKGEHGFGYDPIFLPEELDFKMTAAELTLEEKNRLSHRAKALSELLKKLPEFLKSL